jgi:hypothetical protein
MTPHEQIVSAVARANGKRQMRLLTLKDVYGTIQEALDDGYGWTKAGTVANAYKDRAYTSTVFAVRRSNGNVVVAIGVIDAHKGSSPRPRFVNVSEVSNRNRAGMLAWADSVDQNTIINDGTLFIYVVPPINEEEVQEIATELQQRKKELRKKASQKA